MALIITIGGSPGSGKSTIGRMLAARLHIPFFSMGDIRRQYALERGMSLEELNLEAEKDITSDKLVDEYQAKLPAQHDAFVIDSRLGFHFLPDSIKMFVTVDREVAAQRIFAARRKSEHWKSVEEGVGSLAAREVSDRHRYKTYYGVDPTDMGMYDLVIDSSHLTPEELLAQVLAFLRRKGVLAEE